MAENKPKPPVKMTALEFADTCNFSDLDKKVVVKMYGDRQLTESEWDNKLKKKFNYTK